MILHKHEYMVNLHATCKFTNQAMRARENSNNILLLKIVAIDRRSHFIVRHNRK